MKITPPVGLVPDRLTAAIQATQSAYTLYQQVKAYWDTRQERQTYSIKIDSDDVLYPEVHRWLLSQVSVHDTKSLTAFTRRQSSEYGSDPDDYDDDGMLSTQGSTMRQVVRYQYSGDASLNLTIKGYPITVWLDKSSGRPDDDDGNKKISFLTEKIVFAATSEAGRKGVMGLLSELTKTLEKKRVPRVLVAASWGRWNIANSGGPRDASTVVLDGDQLERLNEDLALFLSKETWYSSRGLPWHRGYLLFGPPGTGKSSLARVLSAAHDMDLYYLPLSDIEDDKALINLISSVPERSVLLLEDIDTVHAAVDRGDDKPGLSAGGLLNALDGVATPHGMITIMTTNNKHLLDVALVRRGRCDVEVEVGYLTDDQAVKLAAVMTGIPGPLPSLNGRVLAPADLVEIVKSNITDMAAARAAIIDLLRSEHQEAA